MAAWRVGLVLVLSLGCAAETGPLGPTGARDAGTKDSGVAQTPPDAGSSDAGQPTPDSGQPIPDAGVDMPDAGGHVGDRCESPADCASADSEHAALYPTPCIAWPGGYCTDYCALPDDPYALPTLQRSDCPSNSVCLPRAAFPGQVPNEAVGGCMAECATDADCRVDEGYFCRRSFWRSDGEITFDNGYCAPPHCQSRGCPVSFRCEC